MIATRSLADHQIEALASCLDGATGFPGRIKIAQVMGERTAKAVGPQIETMAEAGWSPSQVRAFLENALQEREQVRSGWEWVVSGPALGGVPTRDTGVVYRSLVDQARSRILLSSYALYKGRDLFGPLHEAMVSIPTMQVRLVLDISRDFNDRSVADGILSRFRDKFRTRDWPWSDLPEVYYDPRGLDMDPKRKAVLHAKCVIVDGQSALVTSANLTRAAQEKNVEAGVLVHDATRVSQLERFFDGLILTGGLTRLDLKS